MANETITEGRFGGKPIRTFPEKQEKEIREMILRNLTPWIGGHVDEPRWGVVDLEGLIIDVLTYIDDNYDGKGK